MKAKYKINFCLLFILLIGVLNAYGYDNKNTDSNNESAHKKICNKMISIIENNFNLESQGGILINFDNRYDLWFIASQEFDKSNFTIKSVVNAIEKELDDEIKQSFQVRFGKIEDFWIPMNSGLWKNVLSEDESNSTSNELMMIRFNITSGKINRKNDMKKLIVVSLEFRPGEFHK